jgi:hypothetical protein
MTDLPFTDDSKKLFLAFAHLAKSVVQTIDHFYCFDVLNTLNFGIVRHCNRRSRTNEFVAGY